METTTKEIQSLGMPWENEYGYAQAVKRGSTAWLAGQVGHDENGVLAVSMDDQVDLAYKNIKKLLAGFNMTMDDVIEEVLYVMDMNSAFQARKNIGSKIYSNPKSVASTVIVVNGLALPGQLIEIKIVAKR